MSKEPETLQEWFEKDFGSLYPMSHPHSMAWAKTVAKATIETVTPPLRAHPVDDYDDGWNQCCADMKLRASRWLGGK